MGIFLYRSIWSNNAKEGVYIVLVSVQAIIFYHRFPPPPPCSKYIHSLTTHSYMFFWK